MGITKAEEKRLKQLRKEAIGIAKKTGEFAVKVDRELQKQMRKS